jgi:protein-S-isoprenylcysteine O-methyltransferase Ste14
MRGRSAAIGSAVFFLLAPGIVAGAVPWWLTSWQSGDAAPGWYPLRVLAGALVVGAVAVLIGAFARFVIEGRGTPAPVAPTAVLVVGGLYRYVRNPMYVAVLTIIAGQAVLLWRPILLVYALVVALAVVSFAHWYEEPILSQRYGPLYDSYRRAVPGWWPRIHPWMEDSPNG